MTEVKRRTLLGLLASLPIFGRCADAGPPSFELIPALQAGRQWRFAFERKVTRGGAVMHWYRAPLHVRVLEVDAGGALLEWVEGAQTIVDADPQRRPLLALGLAAMREVPLRLRVDAAGRVLAIANAAEVRAMCLALMDAAAAQFSADPDARDVVDQMLPALKAAYASDQMVAAATLREPMILFGAMGRRFGADEPVEFRTALANPLGGAPLPAIARFAIRAVQPRAGRAELGWLMVSDPVAMTATAQAGVDTAARIANDAVDGDIAAPALPPVSLEERGEFVVDTASAWPVRVTHARTVRVGALAQVDSTSFTLA
jgi:hypothetical protein